ncbi:MAG: polyphosphate polymerase domain-containing protein [Chitinophagaceae bacterium]|nr:polyphosphate polymerase domain-containing protein [Chitinophagaceae bacterium]
MQAIKKCIDHFESVSLKQLDSVELQNRIDTKYILTESELIQLLEGIRENQFVLEIEQNRIFNYQTNYFDTEDFQFFKDHHNGCVNRVKVRSREYVESNLCFYEIKRKLFGTRTDKQRKKIPSIYDQVPDEDYKLIQYKRLQNRPIEKKLTNNFQRITLTNKSFTERITIDINIRFTNGKVNIALPNLAVIEVKQGKSDVFSNTIQVLKKLRVHESSFSKYAIGVSMMENDIKHNNFKPILLKVKKISQYGECGTHSKTN